MNAKVTMWQVLSARQRIQYVVAAALCLGIITLDGVLELFGRPFHSLSRVGLTETAIGLAAAGVMLWTGIGGELKARSIRRRIAQGLCPACGYDIRASPGNCPECGHTVAADSPRP